MTDEEKYIYESPDGGKTVYRRIFGDYNSKRGLVTDDSYKKIDGRDERRINMNIKDKIMREWLEARRRGFIFNSVLLGKKEIEELKVSGDKFDEESIEDRRKTTIKMVPVDEKEHLSIANVLDTNEPAHTLNLKKEN